MNRPSGWHFWRLVMALVLVVSILVPFAAAGTASADGPKPGVEVIRDHYGVPHIYAGNVYDLFFGFGYVVAEDRLFQLEMFRRSSLGTAAEVLGPEYIDFDKQTRTTSYPLSEIQKRVDALPAEYQEMLKGYADGINAYIDAALANPQTKLPYEFKYLGFDPPKWTAADVGAVFVGTMATRYSDFTAELGNAALLKYLTDTYGEEQGKAMFNDLKWLDDPGAPTTVPREESVSELLPAQEQAIPEGIAEVGKEAGTERQAYEAALHDMALPAMAGSNAWLIGPKKSASGKAMLFGGPQMGWTTPAYVHEVGLHGAGFNQVGSTTVGYPMILFGYNDNIAWTSTAGVGNVVDIFVEELNPSNQNQYLFNGQWRDMEKRTETIKVKGGAPVTFDVYRTIHGPVISIDKANNKAYSKHRSWEGSELSSWAAWLDTTRASNWDEWLAAVNRMPLTISLYYADRQGNIGYAYAGKYPVRADGIDPRLPTPGTGEYEWKGFIPQEQNPHVLNPAEGFIANWNNQPAAGWNNPDLSLWGYADRVRVIRDAIEARDKISFDDMKEINRHVAYADVNAQYFKPFLIKSARQMSFVDKRLRQAADLLEQWNGERIDSTGSGYYDSPGQAIFETWLSTILDYAFKIKLGPQYAAYSYKYPVGPYASSMNLSNGTKVLQHIFAGDKATLKPSMDYFNGWPLNEATADALINALNQLEAQQGPDMTQWHSKDTILRFDTVNFAGVKQAFGKPAEIVFQNRGTENHLVELGADGIRAENAVPPGESGLISFNEQAGPNFSDQIDLFVDWKYKPMVLDPKSQQ